jgi:glycosyltransferase involved in cell wall biosynthesis
MKFSILIANYNNGKFFKTCYESIITQTYKNWEAIILDDASTDDSLEIIHQIIGNDSWFKVFQNTENSGVGITKAN